MSESDIECTPPELRETAEAVTRELLPEKSKLRYERVYNNYFAWCSMKNVKNIVSENVMMAYFCHEAKTKKVSTLWSTYSMLRSTINIKHGINISSYSKLIAYLKKQNVGYKAKKSNVFTKENIATFLKDAPVEYLPQKVGCLYLSIQSKFLFKL